MIGWEEKGRREGKKGSKKESEEGPRQALWCKPSGPALARQMLLKEEEGKEKEERKEEGREEECRERTGRGRQREGNVGVYTDHPSQGLSVQGGGDYVQGAPCS